ncbi:acyl-CoA dehydrogenase family protein [Salinirubellus salinus]|uniref:Acyl-CoA dehydrogenase family protein n=1 Tax=Salinirubellus salinus TaxID=1364945 RepID=A0A9E7R899_9EURY|nr:acyl-CoA dehydrogenase family protein [Salinirubellus salinus]UWM56919.1 acyl-CoA dehydrogenase family protein [Salinirubellus salinus]
MLRAGRRRGRLGAPVHGGEGLKTGNRLERYYRDARTLTIPDGTTERQKLVVGKEPTEHSAYTENAERRAEQTSLHTPV